MGFYDELKSKYYELRPRRYELIKERNELPKGSIQIKTRNGRKYVYLAYRDDWGDVTYDYIKPEEYNALSLKLKRREELNREIKSVTDELHITERALGRTKANKEYIRDTVSSFVNSYKGADIKRIVLFGSRATSRFRDDSDADFIVTYGRRKPGIWETADLKDRLSEALGLDVDIISADAVDKSMLNIGETEVVYGA